MATLSKLGDGQYGVKLSDGRSIVVTREQRARTTTQWLYELSDARGGLVEIPTRHSSLKAARARAGTIPA